MRRAAVLAAVIRRTLLKRQGKRGVREQIAHPATLSSWETLRSSPQTEERLRVWARVLGLDEEEAVEAFQQLSAATISGAFCSVLSRASIPRRWCTSSQRSVPESIRRAR